MNIFFDLDGTLIDTSRKHFQAHKHAAMISGIASVPFAKYWSQKRNKIAEEKIICASSKRIFNNYEKIRIDNLEKKEFLRNDVLFPWVIKLLRSLRLSGNKIYLVTTRRNKKTAKDELKYLKIADLFDKLLIGFEKDPVKSKVKLIKNIRVKENDLIIGDTEVEIIVAKKLNLNCVSVYSGIRTRELLMAKSPDFLTKTAWDYFFKAKK